MNYLDQKHINKVRMMENDVGENDTDKKIFINNEVVQKDIMEF